MEWTTVRPRGKSNDSEKISVELTVSHNKKQKSSYNKSNLATRNDSSRSRNSLIRTQF